MLDEKLMSGKKGLVMGVANDRSISWAIAKKASDYGAELAFTYQGDALGKRVIPLGESVGSKIILPCDVSETNSVRNVFDKINQKASQMNQNATIAHTEIKNISKKKFNTKKNTRG